MTYYARYDSKATEVTPVRGWYDTGDNHKRLPAKEDLLEVTEEQWRDHLRDPNKGVRPGPKPEIVPFTRTHEVMPERRALVRYLAAVGAGVQVTSAGDPAVSGKYGVDETHVARLSSELQYIASFGEFSSDGAKTLRWALLDGKTEATFSSVDQFKTVAKALLRHATALRAAWTADEAGREAAYPAPTAAVP
jgi:hypothetical protein